MIEIEDKAKNPESETDPNRRLSTWGQFVKVEKEIYEPVKDNIEFNKEGVTTPQELLQVKDYIFKKKYLYQVAQQLEGKL